MKSRNEYIHGMGTTLRHWSTQLGELKTRTQDSEAEEKALVETAVLALKAKQKAYQQQMKRVNEASETAMADIRVDAERMADEFTAQYAQTVSRFTV